MQVNFLSSQTRINLMRSFAGESQARNRYTFAQQTALQKNLYAISEIFKFTADEEKPTRSAPSGSHLNDISRKNRILYHTRPLTTPFPSSTQSIRVLSSISSCSTSACRASLARRWHKNCASSAAARRSSS